MNSGRSAANIMAAAAMLDIHIDNTAVPAMTAASNPRRRPRDTRTIHPAT